jgi:hypothetical protein
MRRLDAPPNLPSKRLMFAEFPIRSATVCLNSHRRHKNPQRIHESCGQCSRCGRRLLINFPISQSADPAGAEACRYSGKSHFIFAPSEPFCGYSFL